MRQDIGVSSECHSPDTTARRIWWDWEPRADIPSFSSCSTNLSDTTPSEWSVKSKCQSILSSTFGVLAFKFPWGELILTASFLSSSSHSTTTAREEVSHQTTRLWQGFVSKKKQPKMTWQLETCTHTCTLCPSSLPWISYKMQLLTKQLFFLSSPHFHSPLLSDRCPPSCPSASL